jgi:ribokinase
VIVVVGSINEDIVLSTPRLPLPGETVRATAVATYPGGKGANQAVAAARMGATVELVGRVGRDAAGERVLEALRADGVGTSQITVDGGAPTGTALITVAEDGTNTIVTVGGANHRVGVPELRAYDELLVRAEIVLVQLEIPMEVVESVVIRADARGVPVILDPAPVRELSPDVLRCATWITPNEREAAELTGMGDHYEAAREVYGRGVENVALTRGDRGCLYVGLDGTYEIDAPQVDAIDTVACGDAFNGALAAALIEDVPPRLALLRAVTAGSEAATKRGAYPSLPERRAG